MGIFLLCSMLTLKGNNILGFRMMLCYVIAWAEGMCLYINLSLHIYLSTTSFHYLQFMHNSSKLGQVLFEQKLWDGSWAVEWFRKSVCQLWWGLVWAGLMWGLSLWMELGSVGMMGDWSAFGIKCFGVACGWSMLWCFAIISCVVVATIVVTLGTAMIMSFDLFSA